MPSSLRMKEDHKWASRRLFGESLSDSATVTPSGQASTHIMPDTPKPALGTAPKLNSDSGAAELVASLPCDGLLQLRCSRLLLQHATAGLTRTVCSRD